MTARRVNPLYLRWMTTVLGIDAAWTATNPSGVALVSRQGHRWSCVALAPSYRSFLKPASDPRSVWAIPKIEGDEADVDAIMSEARRRAGEEVDVVAIDMPVATAPIKGRRKADGQISSLFGRQKCSTHSPSVVRPGPIGERLTATFRDRGYPVATTSTGPLPRALVEVYPHPALLALTHATERLPYKIAKPRRTWREVRPRWEAILRLLRQRIDGIDLELPEDDDTPIPRLKRFEDAIDALVCAWVAIEYVEGRVVPYGDRTAAIWCPTTTLFRPVGQAELDLIAASGFRAFPPRLPEQPIFYPVLDEPYAVQIANDWNVRDPSSGFAGYVTRFRVRTEVATRYPARVVGASRHRELWVPAEELAKFNAAIVGPIEVVRELRPIAS